MTTTAKVYFIVEYQAWDIYECSTYKSSYSCHVPTVEEAKNEFLEFFNNPENDVVAVLSLTKHEEVFVETKIDWPDSPWNEI